MLVDRCTDVLLACGFARNPRALSDDVRELGKEAFQEIIGLIGQFRHTTGERVTSRDLYTATVPAGTQFNPSLMRDEWDKPTSRETRHPIIFPPVIGTTQIGLKRVEKLEGGSEGCLKTVTLLKPTVVLKTMLEMRKQ